MKNNYILEFVESLQPPFPREKKWVIIVSTLFGCPIRCPICDAGSNYKGIVSSEELLQQVDYIISKRFPSRKIPVPKFKIQFARMGEPAFNLNVLEVLEKLPEIYEAPGLMPCISTIAPKGRDLFFERLTDLKNRLYAQGKFQLQFSIHSTDEYKRDFLIPAKKWSFKEIAQYGERFYRPGDRKITLNFALIQGYPVDPEVISYHFDPELFLIKITPLNTTNRVIMNKLSSFFKPDDTRACSQLIEQLESRGYEVILSPGEPEENKIGSNCGQYVTSYESQGLRKGLYETEKYTICNSISSGE
ncbi:MAG: radical SAM protein [candidate division Zixibacteria bacterium]|nr:radical SAM protein [candidate division Zixibacteria bacterium]